MTLAPDALQRFADRLHCSGAPPQRMRETLEASLVPLVRRALRSGAGIPQLVTWVQTTLPQVQTGQDHSSSSDSDGAALPLARLLCATLLRHRPTRPAALETVVSR
jgi:hypothetical protein